MEVNFTKNSGTKIRVITSFKGGSYLIKISQLTDDKLNIIEFFADETDDILDAIIRCKQSINKRANRVRRP